MNPPQGKSPPHASLSLLEASFCIAGWSFGVGYSLYELQKASYRHIYKLALSDLEPGWISGTQMDVSDSEWTVFSEVLLYSLPWMALHFIGYQCLKRRGDLRSRLTYTVLLSMIYLWKYLGLKGTAYILLQPIAFYLLSLFSKNTLLFWALGMWFISGFQWYWPSSLLVDALSEELSQVKFYIMNVTMCWINARCLSYSLDVSWGDVPRKKGHLEELAHFLGYCFYFPLCIGGPIINYNVFLQGINSPYVPWTLERVLSFMGQVLRYTFWLLACFLILHYFYFSALQFEPGIMVGLDLWSLAGLGYGMGQFFHLKYVVFYGFPRPFALADGITVPNHPQCIGRIHLYSKMWRNFDNGLYLFLQRYIYRPVLGCRRGFLSKLLASAVSFGFIYIWHGVMEHVLMWSALNFIGITVESLGRSMSRTESYQNFINRWLSPRMERRLHAALSAPLFLVSIISNFYFFMGKPNGDLYFSRLASSWPLGTLTTLFFMYCGAQTSMEVSNWEARSQLTLKRN